MSHICITLFIAVILQQHYKTLFQGQGNRGRVEIDIFPSIHKQKVDKKPYYNNDAVSVFKITFQAQVIVLTEGCVKQFSGCESVLRGNHYFIFTKWEFKNFVHEDLVHI